MTLSKLISPDEWISVPTRLIGYLSPAEAILLFELYRLEDIERQRNRLLNNGAFCAPVELIESRIRYPEDRQRRVLKSLGEKNLVTQFRHGAPPKRWLNINHEELLSTIKHLREI